MIKRKFQVTAISELYPQYSNRSNLIEAIQQAEDHGRKMMSRSWQLDEWHAETKDPEIFMAARGLAETAQNSFVRAKQYKRMLREYHEKVS